MQSPAAIGSLCRHSLACLAFPVTMCHERHNRAPGSRDPITAYATGGCNCSPFPRRSQASGTWSSRPVAVVAIVTLERAM
jgi:hypothetical protein